MSKTIYLKPRMSEKSYALSQGHNTYVFEVPTTINKMQVTQAVEAQFDVSVLSVRIANTKGKTKRTVRRRGKQVIGSDVDVKKAFVRLAEGQSIAIFPAEQEASKKSAQKEKK